MALQAIALSTRPMRGYDRGGANAPSNDRALGVGAAQPASIHSTGTANESAAL